MGQMQSQRRTCYLVEQLENPYHLVVAIAIDKSHRKAHLREGAEVEPICREPSLVEPYVVDEQDTVGEEAQPCR